MSGYLAFNKIWYVHVKIYVFKEVTRLLESLKNELNIHYRKPNFFSSWELFPTFFPEG